MNTTINLENIAKVKGTDKLDHGYMPFYQKYLPDSCTALLEIGVAKGNSALLWDTVYSSQVDLHLVDLFKNPTHVNPRWCRDRGYVPHRGSQSDLNFLKTIREEFEVIIDDGSHNSHDMWISFKHLFMNNLGAGGLYVIEDLHCCKDKHYWSHGVQTLEDTPLHAFENFPDLPDSYFNDGEKQVFINTIASVHVHLEKIVFIFKK